MFKKLHLVIFMLVVGRQLDRGNSLNWKYNRVFLNDHWPALIFFDSQSLLLRLIMSENLISGNSLELVVLQLSIYNRIYNIFISKFLMIIHVQFLRVCQWWHTNWFSLWWNVEYSQFYLNLIYRWVNIIDIYQIFFSWSKNYHYPVAEMFVALCFGVFFEREITRLVYLNL